MDKLYKLKMGDWKQTLFYAGTAYVVYFATSIFFARFQEKMNKYNAYTTGEEVLDGIDLKGKTAIVTGASAGLGIETTRCLAKKGCKVYMACRNVTKAEKVKKGLIESLKKDGITNPEEYLIILKIDLGSLQSILDCAKTVMQETLPINYLINNAGVMANPEYKETTDGIEWQFGVNHIGTYIYVYIYTICCLCNEHIYIILGHYYLTKLLMPLLIENKARIINVSSSGHIFGGYKETEQLLDYCYKNKCFMGAMKNTYGAFKNYGVSKSANILFSRYLNNEYRKDGIYSISLHPGGIQTELTRDMAPTMSELGAFAKMFFLKPWRYIYISIYLVQY